MAALIVGKNRKFLLSGLRGVVQHRRFAHSSVGEARGPLLLPASVGGAFAGSAKPNKVVVQSTMLMQGMPTIAKLSLVDDTVQVFSSLPILCKGGSGGGGGGDSSSDSDSDDVHKHHNPKTVNKKAEIAQEKRKREDDGDDFDDYPFFEIEYLLNDLLNLSGGCECEVTAAVASQLHARAVTTGVFNFMGPRARKLKIDLASLYGKINSKGQGPEAFQDQLVSGKFCNLGFY